MRTSLLLLAAITIAALAQALTAAPVEARHFSCNVGQAWQPWPQYHRHRIQLFGRPGHFSHLPERCARR